MGWFCALTRQVKVGQAHALQLRKECMCVCVCFGVCECLRERVSQGRSAAVPPALSLHWPSPNELLHFAHRRIVDIDSGTTDCACGRLGCGEFGACGGFVCVFVCVCLKWMLRHVPQRNARPTRCARIFSSCHTNLRYFYATPELLLLLLLLLLLRFVCLQFVKFVTFAWGAVAVADSACIHVCMCLQHALIVALPIGKGQK